MGDKNRETEKRNRKDKHKSKNNPQNIEGLCHVRDQNPDR